MVFLVSLAFWVVFALSHFYLGYRLYLWFLFPLCHMPLWGTALLVLFLGTAFQIGYFTAPLPLKLRRFFIWVGGHWVGALAPLLIGFGGLDVLRIAFLCLFHVRFSAQLLFYASFFILAVVAALLIKGTFCAVSPRVTRYQISVHKKAGALRCLRIALVSDIHLGVLIDHTQLTALCQKINALQPDLILIAGDLLDAGLPSLHDADKISQTLRTLSAHYGAYVCLGNHDVRHGASVEETIAFFEQSGLHVLYDKAVLIDQSFYLIGRADYGFSGTACAPRASLSALLSPLDASLPLLVIDHQPNQLQEAADAGVDVQFSGHTHKGQMFPISLITHRQFETDFGLWKKGDFTAVVSCGYGTWGPRLRMGSRSELVLATLTFDD
jgi:predicted MPP superfamily phosphohydrolase